MIQAALTAEFGADVGRRRVITTFSSYSEAERATDYLADQKFPVEHVSIVAEGIRLIEHVTGRLTLLRTLLNGAASGGGLGFFIGLFLGAFDLFDPLVSALLLSLYGLLFGVVIGVIFGVVTWALSSGRRDFTSVEGIQASSYAIAVDEEVAEQARKLLDQGISSGRVTPSVH